MRVLRQVLSSRLNWMLLFAPLAVVLPAAGAPAVATLSVAALAIVPLAGLLGEATEVLAAYSGPRVGGLLNHHRGDPGGPAGAGESLNHRLDHREPAARPGFEHVVRRPAPWFADFRPTPCPR